MIYSVTLNPSIDFIVRVKDFQLGELTEPMKIISLLVVRE